ncbi:MAG: 50S ribosomal protein L15 [Patescibacteria group bacterium]|nr:50S ribosomal protein L15 [Patescibacteria group bacterium]
MITQLPKIVEKSKKRIGRGHGSGKVKTGGRGQKGQKARGKVRHSFEGGQKMLLHRLPMLRGKRRNKSQVEPVVEIQVKKLEEFLTGDEVTLQTLMKKGILEEGTKRVKIIGNNPISVSLTVRVPVTKGAKQVIENAGGTIIV